MPAESYERLSAQDSSFVMFEHRATHMHVGAIALFEMGELATAEGGLDVEKVSKHIESRLHLLPHYRCKLGFTPFERRPIWVDDARFNLGYHVRHASLPRPGDRSALKKLAGRVLSQHLDRDKPLWEIWLVEGLDGDRFAVIFKIHHCMVDGAFGVNLMTHLLSSSPAQHVDAAPSWIPSRAPSAWQLAMDDATERLSAPLQMARAIWTFAEKPHTAYQNALQGARAIWRSIREGLQLPNHSLLNRPIGPHRLLDWHELDLAQVKNVKNALGGTVNDVVLTVITGALRRLLSRRGHGASEDLRVVVPVNMREGPNDLSAANRVSAFFVELPVSEPDALKRFIRIQQQTQEHKESKAAEGIDLMTRFLDWSSSSLITLLGVRLVSKLQPYNLIVSNVPGPQFPLYLLGARLLEMYPQLPLFENQGVGIAAMSYCGKVFCGMVGDCDVVPDLNLLSDAIGEAFVELHSITSRSGEG